MQVVQWIFMWEYVKNCALKLTNTMNCFNKPAGIRTTEGGEGCLSVSSLPRYCQPMLTTPVTNYGTSVKGLITPHAQLCETVWTYRTDHSLETTPISHSGHGDSAGMASKRATDTTNCWFLRNKSMAAGSWSKPLTSFDKSFPVLLLSLTVSVTIQLHSNH